MADDTDYRELYEEAAAACRSAFLYLLFTDQEETAQFERLRDVVRRHEGLSKQAECGGTDQ